MDTMAPDAQKRLGDLVRQAGQLHLKPEHLREEAEKQLFSEIKLGLLVPAALESEDLVPDDKVAMMRLLLRCGTKKRLTSRAAESLSKILASRSWLKLAQSDATLLGDLRAFSENPEVDGDWKVLLDATPTDVVAGGTGPTPMALDDESRRLILEPLQEGRAVMASCDWRYSGDVAGEGFAKFLRGITRLSNSAKGDGGACVPSLLDWLDGDWTNLLAFFCSMHEAKRLSRSQVEMCVEKLRSLSVRFAEVEAGTKGLPWREASIEPAGAPAEAEPPAPPPDVPPPEDSRTLEPSAPPAEAVATVILPVPKAVPAVPSPPPAPAAAATVVAGGGYPSGPSAAAKPAAKAAAHPKVGVKPTVVWVDGNPEAFQTSRLNTERGITFQGFPSPKGGGGRPWVSYIEERMVADARVAVAIMNSKHKEDAREIRQFCEERRVQPPRFIVMCGKRNTPEDVRRDWGMKDLLVVHDWGDAATAALNEVGAAHHTGPSARAGVEM